MANPNPSPDTRFKPGQSGNPAGKSKEQVERERKASDLASKITLIGVSYVQEKLESGELDVMDILNADMMRFIQEAQNRAYGTPKSTSEFSGPEGGAIPVTTVEYVVTDPADNEDTAEGS